MALPNSSRELLFEAQPDQMDALFGAGNRPAAESAKFTELVRRTGVTFGGKIEEMEGSGSFEDEYAKTIALALDEGDLPAWAKESGAIHDILFIAQAEGKSQDWIIQQISTLPEFEQRFPGLKALTTELGGDISAAVAGSLSLSGESRRWKCSTVATLVRSRLPRWATSLLRGTACLM